MQDYTSAPSTEGDTRPQAKCPDCLSHVAVSATCSNCGRDNPFGLVFGLAHFTPDQIYSDPAVFVRDFTWLIKRAVLAAILLGLAILFYYETTLDSDGWNPAPDANFGMIIPYMISSALIVAVLSLPFWIFYIRPKLDARKELADKMAALVLGSEFSDTGQSRFINNLFDILRQRNEEFRLDPVLEDLRLHVLRLGQIADRGQQYSTRRHRNKNEYLEGSTNAFYQYAFSHNSDPAGMLSGFSEIILTALFGSKMTHRRNLKLLEHPDLIHDLSPTERCSLLIPIQIQNDDVRRSVRLLCFFNDEAKHRFLKEAVETAMQRAWDEEDQMEPAYKTAREWHKQISLG